MKKSIIFIFCMFAMNVTNAEVFKLKKTVECADLHTVAKMLKEAEEKLFWQSRKTDINTTVTLFMNIETQTWTLIEAADNVACIINSGEGWRFKVGTDDKKTS